MPKYGFSDADWDRAKEEGEDTIPYSDLVARMTAIQLDPHSDAMRTFLGEISTAEHDQGRGMLSVVVVYKDGDQMPGPGFFELARGLGYHVRD